MTSGTVYHGNFSLSPAPSIDITNLVSGEDRGDAQTRSIASIPVCSITWFPVGRLLGCSSQHRSVKRSIRSPRLCQLLFTAERWQPPTVSTMAVTGATPRETGGRATDWCQSRRLLSRRWSRSETRLVTVASMGREAVKCHTGHAIGEWSGRGSVVETQTTGIRSDSSPEAGSRTTGRFPLGRWWVVR